MEPKQNKTARILIAVEPQLKLQMENRADRLGLTLSEFIRQCYTDWMDTCSQEAVEAKAMRAYENQ